jgi:cytochrome c oxidase accessory protein FixG
MDKPTLIGTKRRVFQGVLIFLWLAVPFFRINGHGMIEIDLPNLTFYLGGTAFRIEEMYLLWLLIMTAIFLFFFLTMTLGRIWCGWACPQTIFSDFVEGLARRLGMKVKNNRLAGKTWQHLVMNLSYLAMALLVGFSSVWYFVPPYEFFNRLLAGSLGVWPLGSGLVISTVVMLDLALLRRIFCRDFCPYGRFQAIIAHPGTLTLGSLATEIDRCTDCGACVRICPMGIDIRNGFQIECINCTNCIDACRRVMSSRKEKGIIGYTFGTENKGWRALLEPRIILVGIASILLLAALLYGASHRSTISFKLRSSPSVKGKLLGSDQLLTFYDSYFRNLSSDSQHLTIKASLEDGEDVTIKGPDSLSLKANEKRFVRLGLITNNPAEDSKLQVIFSVYIRNGKTIENEAFVTHISE